MKLSFPQYSSTAAAGVDVVLGRIYCITHNPRNGDMGPPAIRNFRKLYFRLRSPKEYHGGSRDIVAYENRRELARLQSTLFEEGDELHEVRTLLKCHAYRTANY